MTKNRIPLGIGIYERAQAARLLRMTPSRLRRWVRGYTYWLRHPAEPERRSQPPVVKSDLPSVRNAFALSFLELMELRVVKAFVDQGVSLQRVRVAARLAAHLFSTDHPFASRRVFTDGTSIFAELPDEAETPGLIELARDRHLQILFGRVLEPFLHEIEFDQTTSLAFRWWPLGRTKPVVLDPRIAFGAPTISGTRIRTDTLAIMARHHSRGAASDAYQLSADKIDAAVEFESYLLAA